MRIIQIFMSIFLFSSIFTLNIEDRAAYKASLEEQIDNARMSFSTKKILNDSNNGPVLLKYDIDADSPYISQLLLEAILDDLALLKSRLYELDINAVSCDGQLKAMYTDLNKMLYFLVYTKSNTITDDLSVPNDRIIEDLNVKNEGLLRIIDGWESRSWLITSYAMRLKKVLSRQNIIYFTSILSIGICCAGVLDYTANIGILPTTAYIIESMFDFYSYSFTTIKDSAVSNCNSLLWQPEFRKMIAMYVLGVAAVLFHIDNIDDQSSGVKYFPAHITAEIAKLGDLSNASWLKRVGVIGTIGVGITYNQYILTDILSKDKVLDTIPIPDQDKISRAAYYLFLSTAFSLPSWQKLKKSFYSNDRFFDKATDIFISVTEIAGVATFAAIMSSWIFTESSVA